ncbi:MAG: hypothetical protein ABI440_08200 [Casimicrobiaceae bacterium]
MNIAHAWHFGNQRGSKMTVQNCHCGPKRGFRAGKHAQSTADGYVQRIFCSRQLSPTDRLQQLPLRRGDFATQHLLDWILRVHQRRWLRRPCASLQALKEFVIQAFLHENPIVARCRSVTSTACVERDDRRAEIQPRRDFCVSPELNAIDRPDVRIVRVDRDVDKPIQLNNTVSIHATLASARVSNTCTRTRALACRAAV